MSTPTTVDTFIEYYQSLLILQYLNKVKATATIATLVTPALLPLCSVQNLLFSLAPGAGTFVLSYNGVNSTAINWNDSAGTIQTKLQALPGLSAVIVTGSIAGLKVTITNTVPLVFLLAVVTDALDVGDIDITTSSSTADTTLPLAIQDAFNLTGPNIAIGKQLDILGKYAGVSRNGYTFEGPVTLNDSDFLVLIQLAIVQNNAGSSLATIQDLFNMFFPGAILVFDYQNMQMDYFMNSTLGSVELAELFVQQKRLPKPMGVQLGSLIYAPNVTNMFGFRTYAIPGHNNTPFNSYGSYDTNTHWLSYKDAIAL